MSGKGDTRRPAAVGRQELERRWERTFGAQLDRDLEEVRKILGASPAPEGDCLRIRTGAP